MAGPIPQDVIEQVRQANDVVDVIGGYLRLKKAGRNFVALCPFHSEKTPSFSVSVDKQIYHCFGCGQGGNIYTFLMKHENMSFVESVRFLAQRAGIHIPERQVDESTKEELEKLHYAHQVALEYFKSTLNSDKYKTALSVYLKEKRSLTEESIELFSLGLSSEEWEGFLNHALKKGLFPKELVAAGLVGLSEKSNKYYDRFRQRLMIPIFNLSGKPIAFGGRALKKGEVAKYLNSPETRLYSKSNVLYGLNFTKQFIRDKNEVIIVEGYFDLISLYQAGVKNVVASSGTAFTAQQARLLSRFAEMAYLFFDADSAGQKAAVRSVDALYDAGMEVMVMRPPQGEDPDSVAIKEGPDGIEKIKTEALDYLSFRTLEIDPSKQGIIAKEKLIKELAELAKRIRDNTRRQLFISEAAKKLETDPHNLSDLLISKKADKKQKNGLPPTRKITDIEKELISLLLNFPVHIELIREKIVAEDFQSENPKKIYSLLLKMYDNSGDLSAGALINMVDDSTLVSEITSLAGKEWTAENIPVIIEEYVTKILSFKRERIIDKLKIEVKIAEEKGDTETARRIGQEMDDLKNRRLE